MGATGSNRTMAAGHSGGFSGASSRGTIAAPSGRPFASNLGSRAGPGNRSFVQDGAGRTGRFTFMQPGRYSQAVAFGGRSSIGQAGAFHNAGRAFGAGGTAFGAFHRGHDGHGGYWDRGGFFGYSRYRDHDRCFFRGFGFCGSYCPYGYAYPYGIYGYPYYSYFPDYSYYPPYYDYGYYGAYPGYVTYPAYTSYPTYYNTTVIQPPYDTGVTEGVGDTVWAAPSGGKRRARFAIGTDGANLRRPDRSTAKADDGRRQPVHQRQV